MSDVAFIALGSNLGDRASYLASARSAISLIAGSRLLAASRVEETAPLGSAAQGPYLNQMVAVETSLPPLLLLNQLHGIERALGRTRAWRWSARTIDLDIVRIGERQETGATLTLPHPGLAWRDFWQREVAELSGLVGAT